MPHALLSTLNQTPRHYPDMVQRAVARQASAITIVFMSALPLSAAASAEAADTRTEVLVDRICQSEPGHESQTAVMLQAATGLYPGDIKAVVSDHDGSQNLDWIKQAMDVEVVGKDSPRSIGESRPFLQWIVDNYDELPSRVFFSHGHQNSWHCKHNIQDIAALHAPVTMLSTCTWKGNHWTDGPEGNQLLLDGLHRALFNLTWKSAFEQYHQTQRRCCLESVVTSDAIRRLDRREYQELIAMIDAQPSGLWGWVFEASWQSMFTAVLKLGDEDRLAALRAFHDKLRSGPSSAFSDPVPYLLEAGAESWTQRAHRLECGTVTGY